MPFTDDISLLSNSYGTGNVALSVSPSVSAINASGMVPGGSASATISVFNLGDVSANLFGTVDFRNSVSPSVSTYAAQAQLLADQLNISVSVSGGGGVIYSGPLDGFINQPAATPLAPSGSAGDSVEVDVVLSLPESAGPAYQGISLDFDFLFVATS
jgi:hypothetical protein